MDVGWQVLRPQLEPLTDQQLEQVYHLQQSSTQAEDALSQGMERLQQTLADALTAAADPFASPDGYSGMNDAIGKLKGLVCFLHQVHPINRSIIHKIKLDRLAHKIKFMAFWLLNAGGCRRTISGWRRCSRCRRS